MVDWKITVTTIYCDAIDSDVPVMVYSDRSTKCVGFFMPFVYAMWERFYEDLDPDGLLFNTVHCPDTGCNKGGWGELIMRMYAREVPKEQRVKMLGSK